MAFTVFLERGLGFPTLVFFWHVLDFYGLKVHELTPNSILHLACFVILCEGYFGCADFFPSGCGSSTANWGRAATCRLGVA